MYMLKCDSTFTAYTFIQSDLLLQHNIISEQWRAKNPAQRPHNGNLVIVGLKM